jgi:hypothetical protein
VSEQGSQGYPEEAPPGSDPGGGEDRPDKSPARDDAEQAPDHDDGKATGNPKTD